MLSPLTHISYELNTVKYSQANMLFIDVFTKPKAYCARSYEITFFGNNSGKPEPIEMKFCRETSA